MGVDTESRSLIWKEGRRKSISSIWTQQKYGVDVVDQWLFSDDYAVDWSSDDKKKKEEKKYFLQCENIELIDYSVDWLWWWRSGLIFWWR